MLVQLDVMITEYVDLAAELKRKVPAISAIMGNKEDVMHPGHRAFYDDVYDWVVRFAASDPRQEDLAQALEQLLFSAQQYEKTAACWYLLAIQNHGKMLIPLLEDEGRESIRQRYGAVYPKRKQLPVQKEIYQMLGGPKTKKSRFCNTD